MQGEGGSGYLSDVIQVGRGYFHSCALKSDGTVYCWGLNAYGQLGNDSTSDSLIPVQAQISDVSQITLGAHFVCALKSDGTVYCWGQNYEGNLGNNSTTESHIPVQVQGLSDATYIGAGDSSICAVRSDSSLVCWGSNGSGELGDGTNDQRLTPVQVKGVGGSGNLTDVVQVMGGWLQTCAVTSAGSAFCWGGNNSGQLGNNSTEDSNVPVQVVSLSGVNQVSTGMTHSCAVKSDGTVYCWGADYNGQLGDNSYNASLIPVQVVGTAGNGQLSGINSVSVGYDFSCALNGDGAEFCWGSNSAGGLGDGSAVSNSYAPVQVKSLTISTDNINLGSFTNSYALNYSVGSKGTLTGTAHQTVNQGGDGTTVTAMANSGYHFVNWSDGSTDNPRTDTNVSRDIRVTANFSPFALSYMAGPNGSLSGDLSQTVDAGDSGSPITAIPDSGYRFVRWSDNSTANPRTDTNVSDDIAVTAKFIVESPPFYAIDSFSPAVKTIDSGTFESLDTLDITSSNGKAIDGANGAAVDPTTNEVYAVLRLLDPNGRYLAQLDMNSGLATVIGKLNRNFAAIAFDNGGQLYGLTGDGDATNPSTLYSINKTTAGITLLAAYANDWTGETLVYNPNDNKLYRATQTDMFAIDPADPENPQTVYAGNSSLPNVINGLIYLGGNRFNLVSANDVYAMDSATGEGVYLGSMDIQTKSGFLWSPLTGNETYTISYAAGAHGSITGTTSQTVSRGANGTAVTAVPDTSYHFVNWNDGSTQNPRTDISVLANKNVVANFSIDTYTLTYTAGTNGTISGISPQTINSGLDGTSIAAIPDAGYHFVDWSDSSTSNPRTDTGVQANLAVTANFAINTYTLNYNAGSYGSISGISPQTINSGSDGTAVTANAHTGYSFVNWSDGSTQNPRTDLNVSNNINVTANFTPIAYTLSYAAGANGSISGTSPQTVSFGSDGTVVTAVANSGYRFTNWSDSSTQNPRTDLNVQGDLVVTANFAIITHVLTYTSDSNGTITGADSQTINDGGNGAAVMAVANTGYHFVNWSDDSTDNPRADANVVDDISVSANFAINTYAMTYAAGDNGVRTGEAAQVVNYGSDGTDVTAIPNSGYHFVIWSDGLTQNPRTDTNVTINKSVTAYFESNSVAPSEKWAQSNWSGGTSLEPAIHPTNASDWSEYVSKDAGIVASTNLSLQRSIDSRSQTTRSDYSAGILLNTKIDGPDNAATIKLQGGGSGQIAAGRAHTCVLKDDGSVYCSGDNSAYQLGNGSNSSSLTPIQVAGLADVRQIAAGGDQTCAVKSNGTVLCWGGNFAGNTPTQVAGISNASQVTVGGGQSWVGTHACALKSDGTVVCWGANGNGQLGNGSTDNNSTPTQVVNVGGSDYLTDISQISAGSDDTCALKSDGTVFCWGGDWSGQLGIGIQYYVYQNTAPRQVLGVNYSGYLTDVSQIATGDQLTCAIKHDGTVYCWGYGNGNQDVNFVPAPISALNGVSKIAIGGNGGWWGSNSVCTLEANGTVRCWDGARDYNYVPDSGYGHYEGPGFYLTNPVIVTGYNGYGYLTNVNKLTSGGGHYCTLRSDGSVYCWGDNTFGQLGNNSTSTSGTPVQMAGVGGEGYLNLSSNSGTFTSTVINTGQKVYPRTLTYDKYTPINTTLTVDVRAGNTATPDETWTGWLTNISSGMNISTLGANQYFQYRANFTTTDATITPTLENVRVDYQYYLNTQTIVSSIYNTNYPAAVIDKIHWPETLPAGTEIKFQLRTSPDNVDWSAPWCGPDDGTPESCDSNSFFTDPAGRQAIDDTQSNGVNDQFVQYRAILSSEGIDTPVLPNVTLEFHNGASTSGTAYTLTYTAGLNGSISGISPQSVISGGSSTPVTAVPDSNYHFVSWNDGSRQNPRTDVNITGNLSVTASFALNSGLSHTLTYIASAGGTISGNASQTVSDGGSGTSVTAVHAFGNHFIGWSDNLTGSTVRTDTNVYEDISATANFTPNVSVTGVTSKYYFTTVTPIIENGTATLNGNAFASGTTINHDGDYTLIATDGYTTPITIIFHIITKKTVIDPTPQKIGEDLGIGIVETQGSVAQSDRAKINVDYTLVNNNASFNIQPGTVITEVHGGTIDVTNLTIENKGFNILAGAATSKG